MISSVLNARSMGRMRTLHAVAVNGSMARAAAALNYTPSAVSQQLALLEEEIGMRLTFKIGRVSHLTEAGSMLAERAAHLLAELERAERDLEALRSARGGVLSIGAFPSAGRRLVPGALQRFGTEHPDVRLHVSELEPEQSFPKLQLGELDMALAYECDLVPVDVPGEQVTLFYEPMFVVHQPRGGTGQIDLRKLRDAPWITPARGTILHEFTIRACGAAGFNPEIGALWTDFEVIQNLAAQGLGVAFVPAIALSPPHDDVAVRETTKTYRRRVFVAWRSGRAQPGLLDAMVEAFRATARALDAPLELPNAA